MLCDSGVTRPGELICAFMKRIGLADHVIVLQPSWNNKVGLGQGHDDLADLGAGFEVLMGCQIFVQPIKNAVELCGERA